MKPREGLFDFPLLFLIVFSYCFSCRPGLGVVVTVSWSDCYAHPLHAQFLLMHSSLHTRVLSQRRSFVVSISEHGMGALKWFSLTAISKETFLFHFILCRRCFVTGFSRLVVFCHPSPSTICQRGSAERFVMDELDGTCRVPQLAQIHRCPVLQFS